MFCSLVLSPLDLKILKRLFRVYYSCGSVPNPTHDKVGLGFDTKPLGGTLLGRGDLWGPSTITGRDPTSIELLFNRSSDWTLNVTLLLGQAAFPRPLYLYDLSPSFTNLTYRTCLNLLILKFERGTESQAYYRKMSNEEVTEKREDVTFVLKHMNVCSLCVSR